MCSGERNVQIVLANPAACGSCLARLRPSESQNVTRVSTDLPASSTEPARAGGSGSGSAAPRRRPVSPSPARRPAADRTAERAGRRGTPHSTARGTPLGTPELTRRAEQRQERQERQERQSRPRHERRAFPPPGTSLTTRPRSLDPTRLGKEGRTEPASALHRPRTPEPPRNRPPELPRSLGESIGLRVESALERLLTAGGVPASPKSSPRGQRAAPPGARRTTGRPSGGAPAPGATPEAKRQRRQAVAGEGGTPPTGRSRPSGGTGSGSSTPTRPEVRTTHTTVTRHKVKSQPLSVPAVVTRAVLISGAPLTERRNGEWTLTT